MLSLDRLGEPGIFIQSFVLLTPGLRWTEGMTAVRPHSNVTGVIQWSDMDCRMFLGIRDAESARLAHWIVIDIPIAMCILLFFSADLTFVEEGYEDQQRGDNGKELAKRVFIILRVVAHPTGSVRPFPQGGYLEDADYVGHKTRPENQGPEQTFPNGDSEALRLTVRR